MATKEAEVVMTSPTGDRWDEKDDPRSRMALGYR
jgi:hypothetical protein